MLAAGEGIGRNGEQKGVGRTDQGQQDGRVERAAQGADGRYRYDRHGQPGRQIAEQRGSRKEKRKDDTGPDARQRAGKVLFDPLRPEQHHREGNADDGGVVHAQRDDLGDLRPQDTRSYAGQESGHHDMRQIGGEASDPEEPQQDLHDAGEDGDEGEFAQIAAVVGEDRGDNDGYGDARTADQYPRTTEHRGHETDDDEAVNARHRAHAGHDTQGHGDRQGGRETDHAGL